MSRVGWLLLRTLVIGVYLQGLINCEVAAFAVFNMGGRFVVTRSLIAPNFASISRREATTSPEVWHARTSFIWAFSPLPCPPSFLLDTPNRQRWH